MSDILEHWRAGHGLPDVLVIDGHAHLGEWPHGANFEASAEAASEAVAIMDAHGVQAACILSGGCWANGADYRLGNDWLLDCTSRAPERLIPFAHINGRDSREGVLAELQRMVNAGVHALKLYNAPQGHAGDTPNMLALYEFAQEHNMLLLNHYWSEVEIGRLTLQYPELTFIRGHGGATRLSRAYANVYDNIWSLSPLGVVERGICQFDPHKILYGSDAFMNEPSVGLGLVVYAAIPDECKRLILGLNMARLLQRVGALPSSLRGWLS
jgi:predicted TIM-barrel fold metal-dependent hydrolase